MNILEDLYYGNLSPSDKCFDKSSEFAKLAAIMVENPKKLMDFLEGLPDAGEERHLLSQMLNAQEEVGQFLEVERFIEGFRLGAGMMLETFLVPQRSVIRDISG